MNANPLKDPVIVAKLCSSQVEDVEKVLMPIIYALEGQGILNYYTLVAALATAAVESRFKCIHEIGSDAYFNKSKYGRIDPITGFRYYGRGIIQLTWKKHYLDYGNALGYDLVNHPEKALEPEIAAKILALYFKWTKVDEAARAQDWKLVRKIVNGSGMNGLGTFLTYINNCLGALKKAGLL